MSQKRRSPYTYLQTPEYRYIPLLRIVTLICFGGILGSICLVGFFLYENIYTSLGQMEAIAALQSSIGYETIDFDRLDAVKAAWEEKHAPNRLVPVRDPFTSLAASSTSTTVTER